MNSNATERRRQDSQPPAHRLRWVSPFQLGEPVLDDAHHRLFGELQSLLLALEQRHNRDAAVALDGLLDQTVRHFLDEESLMRTTAFPGYINHSEQHRRIRRGMEQAQLAMALRQADCSTLAHDLKRAFASHLLRYDRPLAEHVMRHVN